MTDEGNANSDGSRDSISRRRILLASSGLATAGLAGCGGGGGEDTTTTTQPTETTTGTGGTTTGGGGTTTTTAVELVEPVFDRRVNWNFLPEDLGFNVYRSTRNNAGDEVWSFLEPEMRINYKTGQYVPIFLEEPPVPDDCTFTWKYKDGYTWWDGTPVTADDFETAWKMDAYFNYGGPENAPTDINVVDDLTVEETIDTPLSPAIYYSNNNSRIRNFKTDYWKSWVQKFEDATTEDEIKSVKQDLSKHEIKLQTFIDEGLGNGFWIPDDWSATHLQLRKNEEHPRADMTNLDTLNFKIITDGQKFTQAVKDDQLDMIGGQPNQYNLDNFGVIASGMGALGGPRLTISWSNKHLARTAVRRALAYLHSTEEIQTLLLQGEGIHKGIPGMVATNMPSGQERRWLGDDFRNKIIDYGTSSQPDKAAEVLRNAGYEKSGDVWQDSDGDQMKGISFIAPPFGPWQLIAQAMADKMKSFGIKVDFRALDGGAWSQRFYQTRDFDLIFGMTGSNVPHPAKYYDITWEGGIGVYGSQGDAGYLKSWNAGSTCSTNVKEPTLKSNAKDVDPFTKMPIDPAPEFPTTVGQTDLSGGTQRIDPYTEWRKMLVSSDIEEVKRIARKWAWFFNYHALHLEVFTSTQTMSGDTQNFDWPPESNPEVPTRHYQVNVMRGLVDGVPK